MVRLAKKGKLLGDLNKFLVQFKKQFKVELKKIGSTNPDIGYSKTGTNPKTGKSIDTGVPLDYYKK